MVDNVDDNEINIVINGRKIMDIHYHEVTLIKTREDAINFGKLFIPFLENKYGDVKNEDYPNPLKLSSKASYVEEYEGPQCEDEEEDMEMMRKVMAIDVIRSIFCD